MYKKIKLIFMIVPLFFCNFIFAESEELLCKEKNEICHEADRLLLNLIETNSNKFLSMFFLMSSDSSKGKKFFDENQKYLEFILESKKTLTNTCLDSHCNKSKILKIKSDSGMEILTDNPLCENKPTNFKVFFLTIHNNPIAQINYRVKEQNLSVLLTTPTNECLDNEGGRFSNRVVLGIESLTLVPDEGTTKVQNTPTGVQLIKKSKSLMSFHFDQPRNIFKFDGGDGYIGTIDLANNKMTDNNFLNSPCRGVVGRNPTKKTSRMILSPTSMKSNGHKVYDTNQYRLIEKEMSKLIWE